MRNRLSSLFVIATVFIATVSAAAGMASAQDSRPAAAATEAPLINFSPSAGANPDLGSLIQANDGNLYGTTYNGGAHGYGTVFSIAPNGTITVLHSFSNAPSDGQNPIGALVEGTDGQLYGTTALGGVNGTGSIFEISRTAPYAFTLLHSFSANGTADGLTPQSGLIQGTDGFFYGVALRGGVNNAGTIFRISSTAPYTLTVLHSFASADGKNSYARLIEAADGQLYGTTQTGGATNAGTIFRITTASPSTFTTLHSFASATDGANPYAGLTAGSDGNLYGTAKFGGANNAGTIFRISPASPYTLTVLHSFSNSGLDGKNPVAGLVEAADGNFYGTTKLGGANNKGASFQLTPTGTFTLLTSFAGGASDGRLPYSSLALGMDGNLYGTTQSGGSSHAGTAYQLALASPLPAPVQLIASPASPAAGEQFTITYAVPNASSKTLAQCFATNSASDATWSGLFTGAATTNSASLNAPTAPGTYSYALTCGGSQSSIVRLVVSNATPTVAVTGVTAAYGSTAGVTVTATESGSAGPVTGGIVTFSHLGGVGGSFNPTTCTLPADGDCSTTYTPSGTLAVGTYSNDVSAHFSAIGNYTAATATNNVVITQQAPVASIASPDGASPESLAYGVETPFTVTGHLTWTGSGTAPTVGNISFTSTATGAFSAQNCTLSSKAYTCTTTYTPGINDAGIYAINLSFSGDANYSSAVSSQTQNFLVTRQTMTFGAGSVTPETNPYGERNAVVISQVVNWTGSGNAPDPTKFSFTANAVNFTPTCTQSGDSYTCTYTIPAATIAALPVGSYPVTMSFTPAGNYAAFTGQAVGTLTVTQQTPNASMTSPTDASPTAVTYGTATPVSLAGTLNWAGIGTAPTVGDISFTSTATGTFSSQSCTASGTLYNCTSTFTPSATDTPGGSPYAINISFSGDTNYASAVSGQTKNFYIVRQTMTTGAGSVTPNSLPSGSSTAVVLSQVVNWTGSGNNPDRSKFAFQLNNVTYNPDAAGCGTAVNDSYTCTYTVPAATIAALAPGSYPVTFSFTPDGHYNSFTGVVVGTLTITGDIAFSSVTHNMGSLTIGNSSTYGVHVANNTSAAIPFTAITLSTTASPNPFTSQTNCGTSIPVTGCEILFTYAPVAGDSGTLTATWSLSGTAAGTTFSPSNGGTLTGTVATSGNVTITTAGHNFGDVTIGTTSPTYGTVITNSTNATVALTLGSVTAPFALVTNCTASLPAGQNCNLNFTFSPTVSGIVQQVYSISVNGGAIPLLVDGSPTSGVTLTGTGD